MTEDEAKKKWCPFVRDFKSGTLTPASNRLDGKVPSWSKCIGSECMAWRVHVTGMWNKDTGNWWQTGEATTNTEVRNVPPEWRNGFCGLVGMP
jgi:hypothetical protein